MSLSGARVVITAGGAGIGAALARGFAAEGARVALCDQDAAAARAVAAELPDALGMSANVTDEAEMAEFFAAAETHDGRVRGEAIELAAPSVHTLRESVVVGD